MPSVKNYNAISIKDFLSLTRTDFIFYFIGELFSGAQHFQIKGESIEFSGNGYSTGSDFVIKFYTCGIDHNNWHRLLNDAYESIYFYAKYGKKHVNVTGNIEIVQ